VVFTYVAGRGHGLADAVLAALADEREQHLAGLRAGAAALDSAAPQLAVHLQQERQERHQPRPPAAHDRAQQLRTPHFTLSRYDPNAPVAQVPKPFPTLQCQQKKRTAYHLERCNLCFIAVGDLCECRESTTATISGGNKTVVLTLSSVVASVWFKLFYTVGVS
jgi:hypothetical protein